MTAHRRVAGVLTSLVLILAIWWLAVLLWAPRPVILPSPARVLAVLWTTIPTWGFAVDLLTSLRELVLGFALGSLAGLLTGLLIARLRAVREVAGPIVEALRFVVPFSLVPLVLVWFGVSLAGKVFVVAYACYFVMVVNTTAAVGNVDPLLLKAGAMLGLRGPRLAWRVILPAALPRILVGLQAALGFGWVSVIAAEYVGANAGIGYFITNAQSGLETDKVMAGMVVIGVIGSACARRPCCRASRAGRVSAARGLNGARRHPGP